MDFSPPLNPKDYPTYDAYLRALREREEFRQKHEEVGEAFMEAKSDEELKENMEKLGFAWHDDDVCREPWCAELETCLLIKLEFIQDDCNERFFSGLLAPSDKLISAEMVEQSMTGVSCASLLPVTWREPDHRHRAAIEFLFLLDQSLSPDDTLTEEAREFVRCAYLFARDILRDELGRASERIQTLRASLARATLFSADISSSLLHALRRLDIGHG